MTKRILFAILFLIPVLASCSFNQSTKRVKPGVIDWSGEKIKPEVWEAAGSGETAKTLNEKHGRIWLLPFNVSVWQFLAPKNSNKAIGNNFTWNDLLTPVLFTTLPLRARFHEYAFEKGTDTPVGTRTLNWNPFWTWVSEKGKFPRTTDLKAQGIPLFYGHVSVKDSTADRFRFNITNTLWSVGPMYMCFEGKRDAKVPTRMADGTTTRTLQTKTQGAYLFTPVLALGGPGVLLWSDYYFHDNLERYNIGHGPILGLLGYVEAFNPAATARKRAADEEGLRVPATELRRRLIAGVLWSSRVDRDAEKALVYSSHGPLWGIIGWGYKDERPRVQILWIPIG